MFGWPGFLLSSQLGMPVDVLGDRSSKSPIRCSRSHRESVQVRPEFSHYWTVAPMLAWDRAVLGT